DCVCRHAPPRLMVDGRWLMVDGRWLMIDDSSTIAHRPSAINHRPLPPARRLWNQNLRRRGRDHDRVDSARLARMQQLAPAAEALQVQPPEPERLPVRIA